jgi:hypothetical protein
MWVGEFLEANFWTITNRSTLGRLCQKFRQIVSEIFGLSDGPKNHDCRGGGLQMAVAQLTDIAMAHPSASETLVCCLQNRFDRPAGFLGETERAAYTG